MRWLVPMLAVGFWGCGGADEPDPPVGDMTIEVALYDYAFDLESRAAGVRLTLDVVAEGDCFTLPFRATDLGGQPLLDGELAHSGTLSGGQLTLCGAGWYAGDSLVAEVSMTVPEETWGNNLDVGYSVQDDLEGNPFSYLVSWVGGCDRFGPCDNATDKFPAYRFTVAHPSGTTVLCPGRITPGDTQTVCEFDYAGGPTYSTFGLAASPSWEVTEAGTYQGIAVTAYDMPSNDAVDELDTDAIDGFLAFMIDRFGPYPYGDELRIAYGPTAWSGFEHPGNILIYDRLHNAFGTGRADAMRHTISHEIAHMWAGDQTTLADTYDFVWKEAVVEYLSYIWESETLGDVTAPAYWKRLGPLSDWYPVPAERPELKDYYGDVYGLGPMILFRQMEGLFDRDTVIEALQSLLGAERAIGVTDIRIALETATGADLRNYFNTWIYGEGVPSMPVFDVSITDDGKGEYTVRVVQRDADVLYGMAFTLQLTGDNAETYDVRIDRGVDGVEIFTTGVTPGFAVTGYELDPYDEAFAFDAASLAAALAADVSHPMLAPADSHRR